MPAIPACPARRGCTSTPRRRSIFSACEAIAPSRLVLWGEFAGLGCRGLPRCAARDRRRHSRSAVHQRQRRGAASIPVRAGGLAGARPLRLAVADRPDHGAAPGAARRARSDRAGPHGPRAARCRTAAERGLVRRPRPVTRTSPNSARSTPRSTLSSAGSAAPRGSHCRRRELSISRGAVGEKRGVRGDARCGEEGRARLFGRARHLGDPALAAADLSLRGGDLHRRSRPGRGAGAGAQQGRAARRGADLRRRSARGIRQRFRLSDVPRQRAL